MAPRWRAGLLMPSGEGVAARRAALRMLDVVLRQDQTLEAAARVMAGKLDPNDRALALAIAGETVRRIPELDALIDSATRHRLPDDSKARMVLRLALAQKLVMNVPDHALVATALPLVDGGPRRLVHGVLGTLLRRDVSATDAPPLPDVVERRWRRAWGNDAVDAARRLISRRPPLDLSFRLQANADGFVQFVGGQQLAARHVRISNDTPVDRLPGYAEGQWWVQDLGASLPARLIPLKSKLVLDACAAPGGKTMQLAAEDLMVCSVDNSESRLARLQGNLDRTHLKARLVVADLLEWRPRPFDAVLLDAPCSATGTFRRHPEVLYRARPSVISELADQQIRLLERVRGWVSPGGVLVYSVCSLEPEEGERVIADFLNGNSEFAIDPPKSGELPHFVTPSSEGWVRILPGLLEAEGGLDGFFMARLVRRA
ncbi:MAG TPA: RsmB/NOP family class I SAM-dependent RNA methyltransferase [Sphingomicrobium sp.]|nr:RsmB/NOP family class I SAM-dependent RNA methyltransferase [Sphingomicrobium sp.]